MARIYLFLSGTDSIAFPTDGNAGEDQSLFSITVEYLVSGSRNCLAFSTHYLIPSS